MDFSHLMLADLNANLLQKCAALTLDDLFTHRQLTLVGCCNTKLPLVTCSINCSVVHVISRQWKPRVDLAPPTNSYKRFQAADWSILVELFISCLTLK